MSTFTNKTGLQILQIVNSIKINYGKNNLSKIVWHEIKGFSIYQAKDLLTQLIEKEYLKEINVGVNFAINVVVLTEKGKEALNNREDIALDFQRFYNEDFKKASDIGIIDKDIIEEYYNIKKELIELTKREEELKETIKASMTERHADTIHSELMDLYLKKTERVTYPKEKIEKFVPTNILEKIKTVSTITILNVKMKENKDETK